MKLKLKADFIIMRIEFPQKRILTKSLPAKLNL